MIDTHAHIYLEQFENDRDEVILSAIDNGIDRILMPNIDSETIEAMLSVEEKYESCQAMMGLHPCSVKESYKEELRVVEEFLAKRKFIAVGEIGTDLYWDKTFWSEQKEAFNYQCELALHYSLPVVIHCRETIPETIDLVKPWARKGVTGVFHCFTGSLDQANEITNLGFCLGIGGVATFKNGGLDVVLPHIDRSAVVVETDSPYLAPVPNRGKRNEPVFVNLVAEKLANYWNVDSSEVDAITTGNAKKLFGLQ